MLCKYLSYWDKKEPFSSSLHRDENIGKKKLDLLQQIPEL